jgi:hypothetical protein
VGSLQVTCSRLGISLRTRRPRTGLVQLKKPTPVAKTAAAGTAAWARAAGCAEELQRVVGEVWPEQDQGPPLPLRGQ